MPFTKKQREYLDNANHRWNIKQGATRSGKTYATAKRTEIEAEQQKQEMQKRLAALEQLSIKDA